MFEEFIFDVGLGFSLVYFIFKNNGFFLKRFGVRLKLRYKLMFSY